MWQISKYINLLLSSCLHSSCRPNNSFVLKTHINAIKTLKFQKDQHCTYKRNAKARSCKHYCSERAGRITYSLCMSVSLGIQHAIRMRHIVVCALPCPALQYFSTLSHEVQNFREKIKIIVHKNCFDFLCKLVWNTYRSKQKWAKYDHKSILIFR